MQLIAEGNGKGIIQKRKQSYMFLAVIFTHIIADANAAK